MNQFDKLVHQILNENTDNGLTQQQHKAVSKTEELLGLEFDDVQLVDNGKAGYVLHLFKDGEKSARFEYDKVDNEWFVSQAGGSELKVGKISFNGELIEGTRYIPNPRSGRKPVVEIKPPQRS